MVLFLYCLCIFLSQFNYILSFEFYGVPLSPARIMIFVMAFCYFVSSKSKKIKWGTNIWIKTLAIWILYALVSIVWAKAKASTLYVTFILFETFLMAVVGLNVVRTKDDLKKVLWTLILSLFCHSILCILELRYSLYYFAIYAEKYILRGYPVSTFTNTNNLALYLSLMTMILMITFILENKKWKKFICFILIILASYLNLRTGSRGSILSIVAGIFVFVLTTINNKKVLRTVILTTAAGIIILAISPSLLAKGKEIVDSVLSVDINASYGTDLYRRNAYANGLDYYKQTYGFGVSPGNIEYWQEHYATRFTNYTLPLHNWWLEILVASGTIVFVSVIICWGKYYINLFKKLKSKENKEYRLLIGAVIAFGVVWAIGCLSPSTLYKNDWPWIFLNIFFLLEEWIKASYTSEIVKE